MSYNETSPDSVREVQSHSGWRSQSDLVLHFGLGEAGAVNVTVRRPSAKEERVTGTAANRRVVVVEGSRDGCLTEVPMAQSHHTV